MLEKYYQPFSLASDENEDNSDENFPAMSFVLNTLSWVISTMTNVQVQHLHAAPARDHSQEKVRVKLSGKFINNTKG